MARQKTKICLACERPFRGRVDARTCSERCRKRLQRAKRAAEAEVKQLVHGAESAIQGVEGKLTQFATEEGFAATTSTVAQPTVSNPPLQASPLPPQTAPTFSPLPAAPSASVPSTIPISLLSANTPVAESLEPSAPPPSSPISGAPLTSSLPSPQPPSVAPVPVANQAPAPDHLPGSVLTPAVAQATPTAVTAPATSFGLPTGATAPAAPPPLAQSPLTPPAGNQPPAAPKPPRIGRPHFRFPANARMALAGITVITLVAIGTYLLGNQNAQDQQKASSTTPQLVSGNAAGLSGSAATTSIHLNRATVIGEGNSLTATGPSLFKNQTDSATAFAVQDASGSSLVNVNTLTGIVTITGLQGSGAGLTSLNASQLTSGTVAPERLPGSATQAGNSFNGPNELVQLDSAGNLPALNGSALFALDASNITLGTLNDARLSTNVTLNNASQTLSGNNSFTGTNNFTNATGTFSGDGAGLINLNASNIATGTLSDNRLSANVDLLNANQTITGDKIFNGNNTFNGQNTFNGITIQNGNFLFESSTNAVGAFQIQNAAGNDNLLVADTINSRLGVGVAAPNYTVDVNGDVNVSAGHAFRINGTDICAGGGCVPSAGSAFYVQLQDGTPGTAQLGNSNITGTAIAGTFSGSGLGLTNLDASQLATGTVNDVRLSGNVTLKGNTFNLANDLVVLDGQGHLPALDGSNLINLNATQLTLGTVNDARLSTNVALDNGANAFTNANTFSNAGNSFTGNGSGLTSLNASNVSSGTVDNTRLNSDVALTDRASQTFTGTNIFQNGTNAINAFQIQNAAGTSNLFVADTLNTRVGIGKTSPNYTLDVVGTIAGTSLLQNGNAVCDTSGNCVGGGGPGGAIGGSGTNNTIAIFTGAGTIGNSTLTQSGSTVTGTNLNVTGQYQINGSQITSAVLSNDANLAKLNGTGPQTFTGNNQFTGTVVIQPAVDSATAFQIQNHAGTSNLLVADTTNSRIAINQASSLYTLGVSGTINGTTVYQNNNQVCDTSGNCVGNGGLGSAIGGSGTTNHIALFTGTGTIGDSTLTQSGSTVTGTNLNVTGQFQVNGSQIASSNLSDSANLAKLNAANTFQNTTDSTSALSIKNSGGSNLLTADTTNLQLSTGNLFSTGTISLQGPDGGSIQLRTAANSGTGSAAMTFSGNEITDKTRSTGTQGDGRAVPDSSTGIWEGTTNLVTNGGFESNTTGWAADSGGGTISRDTSVAKFGNASLKAVLPGLSSAEGAKFGPISTINGATYTASTWVKAPAGTTLQLWIGTPGVGHTDFTATGTWQRVTFTGAAIATSQYVSVDTASPQAVTFWVDGVQVEQKAYATPYQETSSGVRNAARVQAPSAGLNTTTGWVAFRARMGFASPVTDAHAFFIWYTNSSNFINIDYSASTPGEWRIARDAGGASNAFSASSGFTNAGDLVTIVAEWNASQIGISVNGGAFSTVSSTLYPSLPATFDIGSFLGSSAFSDSDILWMTTGTGDISTINPANFNSFGNSDPTLSSITSQYSSSTPTFAWDGESTQYSGTNNAVALQSGISIDDVNLYHSASGSLELQGSLATDGNITVGTGTTNVSLVVKSANNLSILTAQGNNGATTGANVVITGTDGGANRSAFYIQGAVAGNTLEAGGTGGSTAFSTKITSSVSNVGLVVQGASSQTADLLQLQTNTPATVFSVGATGAVTAKNSADSTNAFQIQNAAGTSNLLIADTTNNRVAIGQATAGYKLDIAGDVNVTTGNAFRVAGVDVCDSTGCLTRAGLGQYIQNTVNLQANANFNIQSTATGSVTAKLEVLGSQTADVFEVVDSTGSNKLLSVSPTGAVTSKDFSSGSHTFFQIQSGNFGSNLLTADTITGQILLPNANLSSTALLIGGDANLYRSASQTLKTDNNLAVGGNATVNGNALVQTTTNSTTAFQVQNNNSQTLLQADTSNMRVSVGSIGTATGQLYVGGKVPVDVSGGGVSAGSSPSGVYVQGHYAYVVVYDDSKLKVFDVSNPGSPVDVSSGGVNTGTNPYAVYVQGHYAYVVAYTGNKFQVFDISNPRSPVDVSGGGVTTASQPKTVYVQGRYAYVTDYGASKLQVFDVSNPTNPIDVTNGGVTTATNPTYVYVLGRYAYVADYTASKLQVFDVSNPTNPIDVTNGGVTTATNPADIYVSGRYLYLGTWTGSKLQVFDVSNPASPTDVTSGGVATAGTVSGVYVQGRYAYVISWNGKLQVFDVSNPASPADVSSGGAATGNGPGSIYVQGRYAYIVDELGGAFGNKLQVFDLGGEYAQQLEAGGAEVGTLQVDSNGQVAGDFNIQGGTSIGQSLAVNGALSAGGNVALATSSNGALSAWNTSPNALPRTLRDSASVVANGYVYEMGGDDSPGSNFTGTVYYAKLNADGSTGTWQTNTNSLPVANSQDATAVTANGYVYYIGGTTTTAVYYAKLNVDGSTGAWQTNANPLPALRSNAASIVANGYVYEIGGTNGSPQSTVYYAKLNADGSIGSWQTSTNALPQSLFGATAVTANGYVYEMGGNNNSSVQSAVYYAKLNADGSIGTWSTNTNSLPVARQGGTSVTLNGYVYFMGGDIGPPASGVFYAKLNSDGSTGTWSANTYSLPAALSYATSVVANGYVYEIGGSGSSAIYYASASRVQIAGSLDLVGLAGQTLADGGSGGSITAGNIQAVGTLQVQGNANFAQSVSVLNALNVGGNVALATGSAGALSAWQTNSNALPQGLDYVRSVTANGYVYVVGGLNGGGAKSTVYYAKLNANGSTGSWTTNANVLPQTLDEASVVTANGYLYVIGGNNGSTAQSTVYYAKLNADGSTGSWQTGSNALPEARELAGAVVSNGYVYIIGGENGSTARSTLYYAKLNADGSVGGWTTNSNALPTTLESFGATVANGYVYAVGGCTNFNCNAIVSTVYYAQINSDGSIGFWNTNSNALPAIRTHLTTVVANGYIYAISGWSGFNNPQSTVYYAQLSSNGSTGSWSTGSNALPQALYGAAASTANGYIYILGGNNNGTDNTTAQSTVYYASISRVQVGGSLDLVGLQGGTLADDGIGGSLTAGNTTIVGTLSVSNQANFTRNVSIGGNLSVTNSTGVTLATDSANLQANVTNLLSTGTISLQGSDGGSIQLRTSANSGVGGGNALTESNVITDATRSADVQGDGRAALDSSTGVWESTTNLVTNGGLETNTTNYSSASLFGGGVSSIVRDTGRAKFGSASLKVTTTGTAANEGAKYQASGFSWVGVVTDTASAWVLAPANQLMHLRLDAAGAWNIGDVTFTGTGAWQRVSVSGNPPSNGTFPLSIFVYVDGTAATSFWIDGVQMEQNTIATPYVDTNDGVNTATRNTPSITVPSSVLDRSQGWVALRYRMGFSQGSLNHNNTLFNFYSSSTGQTQDGLQINYQDHNNIWQFLSYEGGNLSFENLFASPGFSKNDYLTLVVAWNSGNLYVSYEGQAFVSAARTGSFTGAFDTLNFGSGADADLMWTAMGTGNISAVNPAVFNNFGNSDPTLSTITNQLSTASPSFAWDGESTQYSGTNNTPTLQSGISIDDVNLTHSANGSLSLQGSTNSATALQVLTASGTSVLDVDTSNNRVGINTNAPANPLSINALTTAASGAQVAISTGGTGNIGLVVQGVASQSADLLDLQNSNGTNFVSFNNNTKLVNLQSGTQIQDPGATQNYINFTNSSSLALNGQTSLTLGTFTGSVDLHSNGSGKSVNITNGSATQNFINVSDTGLSFQTQSAANTATFSHFAASGTPLTVVGQTNQSGTLQIIKAGSSQTADILQLQNSSAQALTKFNANGDLQIGGVNSAASTTAFQIQNTSGASIFTADTSGLKISLGSPSATPVILVLGIKNTSGDPTCTEGGIYYNSNSKDFRGCTGSGSGASFSSLDGASIISGTSSNPLNSVTGTTFGTGNDLLTSNLTFTADGTTTYEVVASAELWSGPAGGNTIYANVNLDGADGGFCGQTGTVVPLYVRCTVTPSAGSHTVNVRIHVSGGTGSVAAGAGGAGNNTPIVVTVRKL